MSNRAGPEENPDIATGRSDRRRAHHERAAIRRGGTVSRVAVTGGAFSVMTFATMAWAVLPVYGGSPASISYSIAPREYTSLRASSSRSPIACSGLM